MQLKSISIVHAMFSLVLEMLSHFLSFSIRALLKKFSITNIQKTTFWGSREILLQGDFKAITLSLMLSLFFVSEGLGVVNRNMEFDTLHVYFSY